MEDGETEIQKEAKELLTFKSFISKGPIQILAIIGIVSFMAGFFILLSIIVLSISHEALLFPHGFFIGVLLLLGGSILVLGLIILNHEPRRLKRPSFKEQEN